jgi:hypothetical protein
MKNYSAYSFYSQPIVRKCRALLPILTLLGLAACGETSGERNIVMKYVPGKATINGHTYEVPLCANTRIEAQWIDGKHHAQIWTDSTLFLDIEFTTESNGTLQLPFGYQLYKWGTIAYKPGKLTIDEMEYKIPICEQVKIEDHVINGKRTNRVWADQELIIDTANP